jgi:hypothetical protein
MIENASLIFQEITALKTVFQVKKLVGFVVGFVLC